MPQVIAFLICASLFIIFYILPTVYKHTKPTPMKVRDVRGVIHSRLKLEAFCGDSQPLLCARPLCSSMRRTMASAHKLVEEARRAAMHAQSLVQCTHIMHVTLLCVILCLRLPSRFNNSV